MGNANSTNAGAQPASRPAKQSTPGGGRGGAQGRRRRKSVELGESTASPRFSSTLAPTASSSSSSILADGKGRRRPERLATDLVLPGESEADDGEEAGEEDGTLRGAMQGKAEHVVYGPRVQTNLLSPVPTTATSPVSPTSSTAQGARPPTLAINQGLAPPPTLTTQQLPHDPDDTVHPGFSSSPRLTSAVMLSSDQMPVIASPKTEHAPKGSPFYQSRVSVPSVGASISSAPSAINVQHFEDAPPSILGVIPPSHPGALLPPCTSPPFPPSVAPADTVIAPFVPIGALPIEADAIPSGTSVVASPAATAPGTPAGGAPSPAVLLPPTLFNAPVAAIPIPLLSVPSPAIAADLVAAAVDLGAGEEGVPTLIKWKDEDGQARATADGPAKGPKEVFVTGTFAKGWTTKIELRRTDPSDFSALISLPPGPHRLKFIVDRDWKASKHLPVATDADGNLINYLNVNPQANAKVAAELWSQAASASVPGSVPKPKPTPAAAAAAAAAQWPVYDEDLPAVEELDAAEWTQEIPSELVEWGEWEAAREALELESGFSQVEGAGPPPGLPPPPASSGVPPPSLPAQLEKGPLNHAAYVTQGSGDDNSILPKPDHSVINHLAASPIKGGFLSVGVTTRYKRKFVTVVYYKALGDRL